MNIEPSRARFRLDGKQNHDKSLLFVQRRVNYVLQSTQKTRRQTSKRQRTKAVGVRTGRALAVDAVAAFALLAHFNANVLISAVLGLLALVMALANYIINLDSLKLLHLRDIIVSFHVAHRNIFKINVGQNNLFHVRYREFTT